MQLPQRPGKHFPPGCGSRNVPESAFHVGCGSHNVPGKHFRMRCGSRNVPGKHFPPGCGSRNVWESTFRMVCGSCNVWGSTFRVVCGSCNVSESTFRVVCGSCNRAGNRLGSSCTNRPITPLRHPFLQISRRPPADASDSAAVQKSGGVSHRRRAEWRVSFPLPALRREIGIQNGKRYGIIPTY